MLGCKSKSLDTTITDVNRLDEAYKKGQLRKKTSEVGTSKRQKTEFQTQIDEVKES